jgi:hypothetical protein
VVDANALLDPNGLLLLTNFASTYNAAAIFPDFSTIDTSDLVFDVPNSDPPVQQFLDLRPRGSLFADLSAAMDDITPFPDEARPPGAAVDAPRELLRIGIDPHRATAEEIQTTVLGAGIYDDASGSWRLPRGVSAPRLDLENAERALELHRQVLGEDYANAPRIREQLSGAILAYRRSTGASRVVGFELRRWLYNRPATQFDAYRALQQLDQLFSAHRRTGLAPSEYEGTQREWLEAIAPEGISIDELAQAVHPTHYIRGSDILDIFGE